jgi:hypothetical protein
VAKFIQLYGFLDAKRALEGGKLSAFHKESAANRLSQPGTPLEGGKASAFHKEGGVPTHA